MHVILVLSDLQDYTGSHKLHMQQYSDFQMEKRLVRCKEWKAVVQLFNMQQCNSACSADGLRQVVKVKNAE